MRDQLDAGERGLEECLVVSGGCWRGKERRLVFQENFWRNVAEAEESYVWER